MSVEQRIDDLIDAGWGVLETDFDPVAFQLWRRKAFHCLTALVGPDHLYTRFFANFVQQSEQADLLAGNGILSAVQQRLAGNGGGSVRGNGDMESM